MYDALETVPPAEVPVMTGNYPKWAQGAVQPVWVTVKVPRTAPAVRYEGRVTVSADGLPPVSVPVKLEVLGNYVLPDAKDFKFYMGILESPDSLALQYNVPLWSEAHWKLIDKAFELLALIGTKEVHIPAITHTQLGNEQSMVRLVKQADGSTMLDFSIAERYLDTALKHLKTVEAVVVAIEDNTLENKYPGVVREDAKVTLWDPAAKTAVEMDTPAWATPEARTFWKPVLDGLNALLAKRGLGGRMLFGSSSNGTCNPKEIADLRALAPDVGWVNVTHIGGQNWLAGDSRRSNEGGQKVGQLSCVRTGVLWVHWDPEKDPPVYGWTAKVPMVFLCSSRGKNSPDLSNRRRAGDVPTAGGRLSPFPGVGCSATRGWPCGRRLLARAEVRRREERRGVVRTLDRLVVAGHGSGDSVGDRRRQGWPDPHRAGAPAAGIFAGIGDAYRRAGRPARRREESPAGAGPGPPRRTALQRPHAPVEVLLPLFRRQWKRPRSDHEPGAVAGRVG